MEHDLARAAVTRARLEMQGFVGLGDGRLAEIGPWLRLTPALNATWAANPQAAVNFTKQVYNSFKRS